MEGYVTHEGRPRGEVSSPHKAAATYVQHTPLRLPASEKEKQGVLLVLRAEVCVDDVGP